MPTTGGCQCGKLRYSVEGEPALVIICHCINCKRSTGSTYSTNLVIPALAFALTGEPTVYVRGGDSGKNVRNHFCGTCGTFVYAILESHEGAVYLKSGTVDDLAVSEKWKPAVEIYCKRKYDWVKFMEGVASFDGVPPAA